MKNLRPRTASTLLTACDLVPVGDGSFRAVPHKPKNRVPPREAARMASCSLTTIYRLLRAGFVVCERPSPRKILVDVDSLRAHVEAQSDPEFWTPERRHRFQTAG